MPFLILTYVIQVGMIIHVMKTGRPPYWAIILLIAPGIGGIAYFLVEILPELSRSRGAKRAMRGVKRTLDPGGELRRREFQHRLSGSVDAARHLANELMENGRYGEAIEHYRNSLTGIYEHDPDLMLGLAMAQFGDGDAAGAKDTLDELRDRNPDYQSTEGHLLYAKALEATGDMDAAEHEFSALAGYYPGVEARVRYAQLLEKRDKTAEAREQFSEILAAAELAPKHFKKEQKQWLAEAKAGLSRLE